MGRDGDGGNIEKGAAVLRGKAIAQTMRAMSNVAARLPGGEKDAPPPDVPAARGAFVRGGNAEAEHTGASEEELNALGGLR
jgi:hypothetical protein